MDTQDTFARHCADLKAFIESFSFNKAVFHTNSSRFCRYVLVPSHCFVSRYRENDTIPLQQDKKHFTCFTF